jgi:hypothetical protein
MCATYRGVYLSTWNFDFPTGIGIYIEANMTNTQYNYSTYSEVWQPEVTSYGQRVFLKKIVLLKVPGSLEIFKGWCEANSISQFIHELLLSHSLLTFSSCGTHISRRRIIHQSPRCFQRSLRNSTLGAIYPSHLKASSCRLFDCSGIWIKISNVGEWMCLREE